MIRAAIYARFSSQMQRESSIGDQVRICIERAEREDWPVVGTFTDAAISGSTMLRPGLQSMLDHAARGTFEVVLAEALDRLSRDQADVATLYKRLSFHGVQIVTLAEGEITELHVGLKGTMNQLFLKDLAAKTRRGLRGRVEAGLSGGGNSYGYDVVRRLGVDGALVTGERSINDLEACTIKRIFKEFCDGISPKAIARQLNSEGIPGPRGQSWRDTTIRGHKTRGTGLLNNELYIGRLVWNRLRYIKDPQSGRRVSRLNARKDWVTIEVPQLRILDDQTWNNAKLRQDDIEATPRVAAIKASRFWEHRRPAHLLTGLLRCGCCGGGFAAVGRDYLACSAARKLGLCSQKRSFKRGDLENFVLELLSKRLMRPDAVAQFIAEYSAELNAERAAQGAERTKLDAELLQLDRRIDGLYDAIADGLRTSGLKERLEGMEARRSEIQRILASPAPSPVRLHPNLADAYRRKVSALSETLANPSIRPKAVDTIRGLITSVTVRVDGDETVLELDGAITAILELAQPGSSAVVVAGVGFEPTTFRL